MQPNPTSDWASPVPLGEIALPEFPVETLPDSLRDFVAAVAEHTQTPPDLGAMLVLSVVSLAVAGRAQVDVGHLECLSLYTVTAMRPGTRKSAVFTAILSPVIEFESEVRNREAPRLEEQRSILRILRKELEDLESRAAKGATSPLPPENANRLRDLRSELAGARDPGPFRLYAEDATPEQLTTLLCQQGGALGVLSPEGGGVFEIMAGRYSPSGLPNLEVFLKGHVGEPLRVDRRGRAEDVPRAVLSLGLATQPGTLERLAAHASQRERGLRGRFLYSLPPDNLGRRKADAPRVPEAVSIRYRSAIRILLLGSELVKDGHPLETLRLEAAAAARYLVFRDNFEPRLAEEGDLGWMTEWGAKLPGCIARLAALLHISEHGRLEVAVRVPIGVAMLERAIEIGEYLSEHAKAAFMAMDADPRMAAARRVQRWILAKGITCFTKRDAFEGLKGWFRRAQALDDPIAVLAAHNWIRAAAPPVREPGPGRPPSPVFEVNPHALPGYSHNPQNPLERTPLVTSPNSANSATAAEVQP